MELRVLNYFLTVAREKSFSRAAEKLHLTQPTLSRQIMDLEKEYGKQLLIREPRQINLTDDGLLLRRRAEEILSLVEKTEQELLHQEEIRGDIQIGAGESVNFGLVIQVAKALQNKHPNVHFHIVSGDGETIRYHLERGLIDFAYIYGKLDPNKYILLPVPSQDRWVVFMQKDDELAQKEQISPSDLWDKPLLLSRQALSSGTHAEDLLKWLNKPLDELNIVGSYTLLYNATLMVHAGLGYAISFDGIVNTTGTNICTRPLNHTIYDQPYIAWKKNQIFSKPSQQFCQALQDKFGAF